MSHDDQRITKVLERYATQASPPRADLIDLVERRHRRRRGRRIGSSALAGMAVAAVIVGAIIGDYTGEKGGIPAASTAGPTQSAALDKPIPTGNGNGAWHLPKALDLPSPDVVWPDAVVPMPVQGPDGGKVVAMTMLDPTHVLLQSQPSFEAAGALYAYDTSNGMFRTIVAQLSTARRVVYIERWAVSHTWVVWAQFDGGTAYEAYKAPLAGGAPVRLGSLTQAEALGTWVASDDAIYITGSGPGVSTLPMTGGQPTPLPGYEQARLLDASGWAVEAIWNSSSPLDGTFLTTGLRNVFTGQELSVSVPTQATWLTCGVTFCVGGRDKQHGTAQVFVQKLDGSDRADLPVYRGGGIVKTYGSKCLYIVNHGDFILDPYTGRAAETPKLIDGSSVLDSDAFVGWSQGRGPISTYVSLAIAAGQ